LKVPNGAMRFRPDLKPEELKAIYQKYGFGDGDQRRGGGHGQQQGDQSAQAAGGQNAQAGGQRRGGQNGGGFGGRQGQANQGGETPGGGAAPARREAPVDVATVWKLMPDKSLQPVRIKTGITDHTVTQVVQVLKGELKPGEELVVGSATARSGGGNRPPGMGGPVGGGPRR
jgi:hypothetical protein